MNAFIIYLEKSKKSFTSAKNTQNDIKENLKINSTLFNGIDRYDCWQEYVNSGFGILDIKRFGGGFIDSEIATFFSHYYLWKKCLKINKPILIFEHDAIIKNKINILKLQNFQGDLLNLGKPNWGSFTTGNHKSSWMGNPSGIHLRKVCQNKHNIYNVGTNENEYCHCDTMWLFGAHCYLLNPVGAKKLINAAKKGILPADVFIRQEIIDIYDYLPHPVVQESNFTLIQKTKDEENKVIDEWDY